MGTFAAHQAGFDKENMRHGWFCWAHVAWLSRKPTPSQRAIARIGSRREVSCCKSAADISNGFAACVPPCSVGGQFRAEAASFGIYSESALLVLVTNSSQPLGIKGNVVYESQNVYILSVLNRC